MQCDVCGRKIRKPHATGRAIGPVCAIKEGLLPPLPQTRVTHKKNPRVRFPKVDMVDDPFTMDLFAEIA